MCNCAGSGVFVLLLVLLSSPDVLSGIRKNENGAPEEEENFDEAIKNVNTALNPTKVQLMLMLTPLLLLLACCADVWISLFCRSPALWKTSSTRSSVRTSRHRSDSFTVVY